MREMKCRRCGANENRIHGFCSMECETAWEYEDDIRDLIARIAELEALVERLIEAGDRLSDSLCTYPEEEKTIEVCNWNAIVAEYKECEK